MLETLYSLTRRLLGGRQPDDRDAIADIEALLAYEAQWYGKNDEITATVEYIIECGTKVAARLGLDGWEDAIRERYLVSPREARSAIEALMRSQEVAKSKASQP